MIEPNPVDYLNDPLSEITRTERRNLLIASTVGLLVAKGGLVPSKILAFDIELPVPEQEVFITLVALTVFYFVAAFVIYGVSDFFVWRKKYQDYLEQVSHFQESWSEQDQNSYDELHTSVPKITWLYRCSKPVAFTRILFEYAVPIIFGLVAIAFLVHQLLCP